MDITDELERLSQLHKSGALNDAEYAQAKSKVLAQQNNPPRSCRQVPMSVAMALMGVIVFLVIFFTIILPRVHENNRRTFQIQLPP